VVVRYRQRGAADDKFTHLRDGVGLRLGKIPFFSARYTIMRSFIAMQKYCVATATLRNIVYQLRSGNNWQARHRVKRFAAAAAASRQPPRADRKIVVQQREAPSTRDNRAIEQNADAARTGDQGGRMRSRSGFDISPGSSTAMRIRSGWFFAPSFCLSSEVVLAAVL
jgi:hypothetical protein